MNFLRALLADLRERQLLPIYALLAGLAIAVPVGADMMFGNAAAPAALPAPPAPAAAPRGVPSPADELTAVGSTPSQSYVTYKGTESDPFAGAASSSGGSSSASSTSSSSSPSPSTSGGATSTPSSSTGSSSKPSATTKPKATKPAATKPRKAPVVLVGPASLAANESYSVAVDTIDATGSHSLTQVQRLSLLPANDAPEIVLLGVLKGGAKAAFLLTGPDSVSLNGLPTSVCYPSPADCRILEISPGQGLKLSPTKQKSLIYPFTFKLHSIGVDVHSSVAAATAARKLASPAGAQVVALVSSPAVSTLRFDESIGALVAVAPKPGGGGGSGATGASGSTGATTPSQTGSSLVLGSSFVLSRASR